MADQTTHKWLSAAELEQLDDEELDDYRVELEHRIETTNDRNLQTILVAAIKAVDEKRSRRQRPWAWGD